MYYNYYTQYLKLERIKNLLLDKQVFITYSYPVYVEAWFINIRYRKTGYKYMNKNFNLRNFYLKNFLSGYILTIWTNFRD